MWIMTTTGFFSIVGAGNGTVQVRARSLSDVQALCKRFLIRKNRILHTPHADYPYRVLLHAKRWSNILATLAEDTEHYTNFKGEVGKNNPERAATYYDVWVTLQQIHKER